MNALHQPVLYPVVSLITGSTPRGGGLWKYILRLHPHALLRRNLPVMSQVLHFLDFKVSPRALAQWRQKPLRMHYNGNFGLRWTAPLFLDSGGFTLMYHREVDLSPYGIHSESLQYGIFQLQLDLGADILVSLDYPIPPGLDREEIRYRMAQTKENALEATRLLQALPPSSRPRLFVPVHGPTPEALASFISDLWAYLGAEGLREAVTGLALGSMVPKRKNGWNGEILAFVRAARRATPEEMPLHIFGVTGSLIPFLLAEGVTSFDSSSYVQNARGLRYMDPATRRYVSLRTMERYTCECPICRERDLREDMAILGGKIEDREKSEVYAAVALHNLEMDFSLLHEAYAALVGNTIHEFLRTLPRRYPSLRWPDRHQNGKQGEVYVLGGGLRTHTPDDFDLRRKDWKPSPEKRVVLFLPCSREKPYTLSRSFRYVWSRLEERLGGDIRHVQVIFISGLYGPVPMEYVEEEPVRTYDFMLRRWDRRGIRRVGERLTAFFTRHWNDFEAFVAYVTQPAYRIALKQALRPLPTEEKMEILPKRARGRLSFYKQEHIDALTRTLASRLR